MSLVSVDTQVPNRLIEEALRKSALKEFQEWALDQKEFTIGRSRIDFLLRNSQGEKLALEIKSVTLVENKVGLFPDAVTARGARHMNELAHLAQRDGWHATVLFVVQRPDARRVLAAPAIDPTFARALAEAKSRGVQVLGRRCHVDFDGVYLGPPIPAG